MPSVCTAGSRDQGRARAPAPPVVDLPAVRSGPAVRRCLRARWRGGTALRSGPAVRRCDRARRLCGAFGPRWRGGTAVPSGPVVWWYGAAVGPGGAAVRSGAAVVTARQTVPELAGACATKSGPSPPGPAGRYARSRGSRPCRSSGRRRSRPDRTSGRGQRSRRDGAGCARGSSLRARGTPARRNWSAREGAATLRAGPGRCCRPAKRLDPVPDEGDVV
jgi:hypothetical protein